jgi:hypothetical protein
LLQGAHYVFLDKGAVGAGCVRNATCVGRRIDLDEREPADDLSCPYRVLRYPPIAVWVEPKEAPAPLGGTCAPFGGPVDCLPVVPRDVRVSAKFGKGERPKVHGREVGTWSGFRMTVPLGHGFAVTDYAVQGQSFGDATWFAHLGVPDSGPMARASVLVILTRFRDWAAVRPWAPLWPPGDMERRRKVIDAFHRAAKPKPDLVCELRRLAAAEVPTLVRLRHELRHVFADDGPS